MESMEERKRERFCPFCGSELKEKVIHQKLRPFCPRCGYVLYRDPKVVVAVIIANDGKVLLSRRNHEPGYGLWSFPSGFVDEGESVEEAAIRETREETNLDIQLESLLGIYAENGKKLVLVVYKARIVGGQLAPSEEVMELEFFDPDKLPQLAFDHDRRILQDWAKT